MTQELTYDQCVDQMVEAVRAFALAGPMTLPMAEAERVQRTLATADSVGPIFFPSEWMAAPELDRQKKLVEVYLRVCGDLRELFPEDPILNEILSA